MDWEHVWQRWWDDHCFYFLSISMKFSKIWGSSQYRKCSQFIKSNKTDWFSLLSYSIHYLDRVWLFNVVDFVVHVKVIICLVTIQTYCFAVDMRFLILTVICSFLWHTIVVAWEVDIRNVEPTKLRWPRSSLSISTISFGSHKDTKCRR